MLEVAIFFYSKNLEQSHDKLLNESYVVSTMYKQNNIGTQLYKFYHILLVLEI